MNVYIICPVRGAEKELLQQILVYVNELRAAGHNVHYPPDDVNQNDATGENICRAHRNAMQASDQVHVFWDVQSAGSHFDLGMAYALGKEIIGIQNLGTDSSGKSYWKAAVRAPSVCP